MLLAQLGRFLFGRRKRVQVPGKASSAREEIRNLPLNCCIEQIQSVRIGFVTFEMDWPPKGGKLQSFPEIDRAAWFDLPAAHVKMLESQRPLLDRLVELVDRGAIPAP